MKLNDQILLMEENGVKKIILLSGDITEDDELLIASDLFGKQYLIDWDLAGSDKSGRVRFKYTFNKQQLKELVYDEELLPKFNLTNGQEVSLEDLKSLQQKLNQKSKEF